MSYVIVNYPKILNQTKFKPFMMKNKKKIFKHWKIDSKRNDEIGISKGWRSFKYFKQSNKPIKIVKVKYYI